MAFPRHDLLACMLEGADLCLKLSAGSGRKSSHKVIMNMSTEFHHCLLQLLLKMRGLGGSWGQEVGLEPCKSEVNQSLL